jgi:hypothetical protein
MPCAPEALGGPARAPRPRDPFASNYSTLPCAPRQAAVRVSGLELGGLFGSLLAGRLSDMMINKSGGKGGNVGKRVQVRGRWGRAWPGRVVLMRRRATGRQARTNGVRGVCAGCGPPSTPPLTPAPPPGCHGLHCGHRAVADGLPGGARGVVRAAVVQRLHDRVLPVSRDTPPPALPIPPLALALALARPLPLALPLSRGQAAWALPGHGPGVGLPALPSCKPRAAAAACSPPTPLPPPPRYGPQMLIGLCGAELVGPDSVGASEGFLG